MWVRCVERESGGFSPGIFVSSCKPLASLRRSEPLEPGEAGRRRQFDWRNHIEGNPPNSPDETKPRRAFPSSSRPFVNFPTSGGLAGRGAPVPAPWPRARHPSLERAARLAPRSARRRRTPRRGRKSRERSPPRTVSLPFPALPAPRRAAGPLSSRWPAPEGRAPGSWQGNGQGCRPSGHRARHVIVPGGQGL